MDARPSGRIKHTLLKLVRDPRTSVTIVSGRDINSLLELFNSFDISGLNWAGTHGMQIRFTGSDRVRSSRELPIIAELKGRISEIIDRYPCFDLEDKGLSFALHYRKCPETVLFLLEQARKLIERYRRSHPVEVLDMKKVIEVKPAGLNKGDTIGAVLNHYGAAENTLCICIGDDITDEYLFRSNPEGINIKVGAGPEPVTAASYYLKGVSDVFWFLKTIYSFL